MVAAAMTALKTVRHLAAVKVVVAVAVKTIVVNQASVTPNSVIFCLYIMTQNCPVMQSYSYENYPLDSDESDADRF